jgi:predicted anti-sigma-YlaC factor YlaD
MNEKWHPDEAEIGAYLDGELDSPQRQRISSHLEACPACQEELARLKVIFSQLSGLPDLALERDLSRDVVSAIRSRETSPAEGATTGWRGFLKGGQAWVAAVQAGLTALLFGLFGAPAWQSWTAGLDSYLLSFLSKQQQMAQSLLIFSEQLSGRWLAAVQLMQQPLPWNIPSQQALIILAVSGLTWLVGTRLLLKKPEQRI